MNHSEHINEIITALTAAQKSIVPPQKVHTANVQTKSGGSYAYTYTGLAEALESARLPLAENGLVLMQIPHDSPEGDCIVESVLAHSSGQWMSGILRIKPVEQTPQGFGSCLTYTRRYSALMMLGVAPEDDDAQGAMGDDGASDKTDTKPPPKPASQPQSVDTGEYICPIHNIPFRKNTNKNGESWWSHQKPEGGWCNESAVMKQLEATKGDNPNALQACDNCKVSAPLHSSGGIMVCDECDPPEIDWDTLQGK